MAEPASETHDLLYIYVIDASDAAVHSEDYGADSSRLSVQKESFLNFGLVLGPRDMDHLHILGDSGAVPAQIAVVVMHHGRATVAVTPTGLVSDLQNLNGNLPSGGESKITAGLNLACLLASRRRESSPSSPSRIFACLAGRPAPFSLKEAKDVAARLASSFSMISVACLASPAEIGALNVEALLAAVGENNVHWIEPPPSPPSSSSQTSSQIADPCLSKYEIREQANWPSFIAKEKNQKSNTGTTTTISAPSSSSSHSGNNTTFTFTKSVLKNTPQQRSCDPLPRSAFTCRDASLDVLVHQSPMLRTRIAEAFSSLANRLNSGNQSVGGAQQQQQQQKGGGIPAAAAAADGCYIRLMPQPRYRTLLCLKAAPLVICSLSADGDTNGNNRVMCRGQLGTLRILQDLRNPSVLVLTWSLPSSSVSISSHLEAASSSSARSDGSGSTPFVGGAAAEKKGEDKVSSAASHAVDDGEQTSPPPLPPPPQTAAAAAAAAPSLSDHPINMFDHRRSTTSPMLPMSIPSLVSTIMATANATLHIRNPVVYRDWEYWMGSIGSNTMMMTPSPTPPNACQPLFHAMQVLGEGATVAIKDLQGKTKTKTNGIRMSSKVLIFRPGVTAASAGIAAAMPPPPSMSPPHQQHERLFDGSITTATSNGGGSGGGGAAQKKIIWTSYWIPSQQELELAAQQQQQNKSESAVVVERKRALSTPSSSPSSRSVSFDKNVTKNEVNAGSFVFRLFCALIFITVFTITLAVKCINQAMMTLLIMAIVPQSFSKSPTTTKSTTKISVDTSTDEEKDEKDKEEDARLPSSSPSSSSSSSSSPSSSPCSLCLPLSEDALLSLTPSQLHRELNALLSWPPSVSFTEVVAELRESGVMQPMASIGPVDPSLSAAIARYQSTTSHHAHEDQESAHRRLEYSNLLAERNALLSERDMMMSERDMLMRGSTLNSSTATGAGAATTSSKMTTLTAPQQPQQPQQHIHSEADDDGIISTSQPSSSSSSAAAVEPPTSPGAAAAVVVAERVTMAPQPPSDTSK